MQKPDIRQAAQLHQRGQLAEAEQIYRALLQENPKHFDATHLLGVVFMQKGDAAAAEKQIQVALTLNPANPQALSNLGNALSALGRLDDALTSFTRAVELKPDFADAWMNRGNTLRSLQRPEEALASYHRAVAISPKNAAVHVACAKLLRAMGRMEEALAAYERALPLSPRDPAILMARGQLLGELGRGAEGLQSYAAAVALQPNYVDQFLIQGNALMEQKKPAEALDFIEQAVALNPQYAEAHLNRGNALMALGRVDEALACYERAAVLKPNYAEAFFNKGNLLHQQGRPEEALASYSRAIAADPGGGHAPFHLNRANLLRQMHRHDEAMAAFDRALALNPRYAEAYNNKAALLRDLKRQEEALACQTKAAEYMPQSAGMYLNRGNILRDLNRLDLALADYERALALEPGMDYLEGLQLHTRMHLCDWRNYDDATTRLTAKIMQGLRPTVPFAYLALPSTAAEQLKCATDYAAFRYPAQKPLWQGKFYRHDKIRVAYLSADYREHATAILMAELFEEHDKSKFDFYALSFGPDDGSAMMARLKASFKEFIDVRDIGDAAVAKLMLEREIDIAVDLKGFTQDARAEIFSHRAAPVQANFIGYPGTMGAPYIDYIIADGTIIPPALEGGYTEKVARLPGSYQPNDRKRAIAPSTPPRTEHGLPEKGFVFCCFNNIYKVTPDIFDIWMKLLKQVDGSVLWLLEHHAKSTENLRAEAAKRGIDPARLVFAPRMKLPEHLARHRHADLFVDTLPYNAHTTASDALWAGLPLVTCAGKTFASRVAASLLEAAGMPELVTGSLKDYEALALSLARDLAKLAAIKKKMEAQRDACALFDTKRYARGLEDAFTQMLRRAEQGLPPASFTAKDTP